MPPLKVEDYLKRMDMFDDDNKPRTLMQDFGQNLLRKINPNFLINRLLEDIEVFSYFYDIIIVTDARLKDEVVIPKEKFDNVTTIRVIRNDYDNGLTKEEKENITEIALDNFNDFDKVIYNDSYLEENVRRYLSE